MKQFFCYQMIEETFKSFDAKAVVNGVFNISLIFSNNFVMLIKQSIQQEEYDAPLEYLL